MDFGRTYQRFAATGLNGRYREFAILLQCRFVQNRTICDNPITFLHFLSSPVSGFLALIARSSRYPSPTASQPHLKRKGAGALHLLCRGGPLRSGAGQLSCIPPTLP